MGKCNRCSTKLDYSGWGGMDKDNRPHATKVCNVCRRKFYPGPDGLTHIQPDPVPVAPPETDALRLIREQQERMRKLYPNVYGKP